MNELEQIKEQTILVLQDTEQLKLQLYKIKQKVIAYKREFDMQQVKLNYNIEDYNDLHQEIQKITSSIINKISQEQIPFSLNNVKLELQNFINYNQNKTQQTVIKINNLIAMSSKLPEKTHVLKLKEDYLQKKIKEMNNINLEIDDLNSILFQEQEEFKRKSIVYENMKIQIETLKENENNLRKLNQNAYQALNHQNTFYPAKNSHYSPCFDKMYSFEETMLIQSLEAML
ncbi:Hypothetical_protein [Hexamita inflata]|uniref:Hypothetical_protein n=1 Tax=Hexamita inflata TaxID=28002 RepID=A0AA86PRJ9_9EUKA|nr:Hypothetical protein HINF_LOCUS32509 [Hexamita inflata]